MPCSNVFVFHPDPLEFFSVSFPCLVPACSVTSVLSDSAMLWTVAHQATLSMGFSREEQWSGFPFPIPGDLPNPGTEPVSLVSPALPGRFFTTEPQGKPTPSLGDFKNQHQQPFFQRLHFAPSGANNTQVFDSQASPLSQGCELGLSGVEGGHQASKPQGGNSHPYQIGILPFSLHPVSGKLNLRLQVIFKIHL